MDRVLGIKHTTLDNVVLLASRLLLAWIFVHEGVFLAMNFAAAFGRHGQRWAFLQPRSFRLSAFSLLRVRRLRWVGMRDWVRQH